MEDVWANAWSQPEEDVAHTVPPKTRLNDLPSWSLSSGATVKDEEADVGVPSWTSGEVDWAEPTGQASLWSSTSVSEDLALGTHGWDTNVDLNPHAELATEEDEEDEKSVRPSKIADDVVETEERVSRVSTPESSKTVTSPDHADSDSPSMEIPPSLPLAPSSGLEQPEGSNPDTTFGSYEDGLSSVVPVLNEGESAWTSPKFGVPDPEEDAWGSAWQTPEMIEDTDEAPKDEWTIAREQKEKRDRTVVSAHFCLLQATGVLMDIILASRAACCYL